MVTVTNLDASAYTGVILHRRHHHNLDYKDEHNYTFVVMVQYQTATCMPFYASATVEVSVIHINNNPPSMLHQLDSGVGSVAAVLAMIATLFWPIKL